MSIYEVHLGSWRQGLTYQAAGRGTDRLRGGHGFTHVELLPVMEHPFGGSWGYQVSAYFAPTARFGKPDDFRYLVDRCTRPASASSSTGCPAHFPKDEFALARFDGTPLYEHADPRRASTRTGARYVFDFGRNEVRNFLVANARLLVSRSSTSTACGSMRWPPCSTSTTRARTASGPQRLRRSREPRRGAFLQQMNATVYKRVPGAFTVIAEESTAWPGVTRGRTWGASASASSGTWAGCTTP
jgi:1,4-alpha-glucan branching enzyme